MFFEDMGITYLGPVNGHDCSKLIQTFQEAKKISGPVLVHVKQKKAGDTNLPCVILPVFTEQQPLIWKTVFRSAAEERQIIQTFFLRLLRKFGDRDERVVAVTAAMPDGTGLKRFRNMFPERFFDVGIAEEHAVTFAAGLALGGMIPVVAIYSSFLQRAVDQMIEDVCLQNLHVILR